MDVKITFLNGELDEEVSINQPQGFIMPGNENKMCKLIKSLYGLKQAPKQWNQNFDEVVLSNGYLLNQADKYVDLTKEFLSSRFSMKNMGEADVILDIRIKYEMGKLSSWINNTEDNSSTSGWVVEDKDMQKNLLLNAKEITSRTSTNLTNNNHRNFLKHQKQELILTPRKVFNFKQSKSDLSSKTRMKIDEQDLEDTLQLHGKDSRRFPNADSWGTDFEPFGNRYNMILTIIDDQNDVECDDELLHLPNLIANLKLDVDENKKIQKQLNKGKYNIDQELTESTSISIVKEKHDELVKQSLLTKSHYEGLVKEKTKVITDLKLKEEKDIDKMISMENQLKFLNEIVYKRSQSIQTIHMLAPKCPTFNGRPTFANPRYLKKAQNEIPCLYAIPHDQSDPANRLVPDREETLTLDNESQSKLNKDLANEIRKKMWRKSFVKTKPNIFKNIDFLPVSKSISKSRQAYNVMTNNINHLKEIVNQAWVKHSNDLLHLRNPTAQDMEILVKTCLMPLALKTQNDSFAFVHELKQEMHADLKYVESLEDELDELESDKAEFSNMYDMLLQECVSKDVMCSYLQSSSDLDEITELQCLYLHKVRECDCLAQKLSEQTEFVSKEIYTELLQSFAKLEKHSISLEIALQECQEQLKNDTVCKEKASNVFRKEREQYFEIQDLKAQLQDKNIAISELKKLIEKCKGKSVDTKFDKPSVVRQPNAQRIPKPSVLGKPVPFSDSLERKYFANKKSVLKTNESEGLSKPVTLENLPQTATQAVRNTNVIKPGMYRITSSTTQTRAPQLNQTSRNTNPRVSTSTGVAHKPNVSRPQPRSNQMKDKVVPNTSHVKFKKTEVEEHPRISSISNQTKSVIACNDSLNSRTSNVNAVCATCRKCVFNANHDACVSKFLKDVNTRTNKPNGVPISTRKPKRQANKFVTTPHKKTVASESTITNSKSYYRMLYKKTNKAWKWWIAQQCPSAYTWVPKTKRKWVPKVRNESVTKKIVQLILFIVDSGCTKHMTGNLSLLCNFVEKYLGTVRFGNDQFAPILGYGDLVQGNITIKRVYYVEGLNHNLFSVGQFCDADLEVAFRKSTCFVRDLQGNDLLTGNRGTDLYTISLQETTSSTPICLMAKASPTQAWLWHRRLSHLNFDYINLLSKKDVVIGLPKLKYVKDQLCSSCEVSKAKRSSFKSKTVPSSSKFKRTVKFASYGLMWSNAGC
ncbi:retrovirus-related pol polyprotein from transposon TNT 1-94 [Tanacetum coccineum]